MRIAGSDAVILRMENSGTIVSQQIIDAERTRLGLDQYPFSRNILLGWKGCWQEIWVWVLFQERMSFPLFVSKLPATLLLTGTSILLTVLISIPLGILSAVKHNKGIDYLIRFRVLSAMVCPIFLWHWFWCIFFPSVWVFPVITQGTNLTSAALPTLTLSISMSAKYLRQVQATVLEELEKEYVIGAKARIGFSLTLWKSVLKLLLWQSLLSWLFQSEVY